MERARHFGGQCDCSCFLFYLGGEPRLFGFPIESSVASCRWFCINLDMAASDEVELQVEELMVSSSLDALCHVAQKLDLNEKYWEGKPKLTVIKAIRKCYDVSDSEVKKTLLVSITNALKPVAASAPPPPQSHGNTFTPEGHP